MVARSICARLGAVAIASLGAGFSVWAATASTSVDVVATGIVVSEADSRTVRHSTGGTIGEIRKHNGDQVASGDIVGRLDDTAARRALSIVAREIDELVARRARLDAERDGESTVTFPQRLTSRAGEPDIGQVMATEADLFRFRRWVDAGRRDLLRRRLALLEEELSGFAAQAEAKASEVTLLERELDGARALWSKNLMPISKLTSLERDVVRLRGEHTGLIVTSAAQAKGRIAEIEMQMVNMDRDRRREISDEMRDIDARLAALAEREVMAEDQMRRIDIRAPQGGIVQHATRGVGDTVAPGEELMLIVAPTETLTVEAKVAAKDAGRLQVGRKAVLRLPASETQAAPQLSGTLSRITTDAASREDTANEVYSVRIAVPRDEVGRLGADKPPQGTRVDVLMRTTDRWMLSQLVRPLLN